MAITRVFIKEFLSLAESYPVIDVRSPGEYEHAHIPGAISFPLFSDEERKVVGTAYKQQGKQVAIKHGLGFFGVKLLSMVEKAEAISLVENKKGDDGNRQHTILVHCWRGGMRSAAIAWLLDLYGFRVYTLTNGYKAYRNWVLQQFEIPYDLVVLGGYTGSNKTALLKQLEKAGEQMIDLERLASHRGSAFGALGMDEQPTQEMFENLLATELHRKANLSRMLWLEDESRRIGKLIIPTALFEQMRCKSFLFLEVPFEERLRRVLMDYGGYEKMLLQEAIERIQKKLGGLETKKAITFLQEGNTLESFRILLEYYDKCYLKGLNSRQETGGACNKLELQVSDAEKNASVVLQHLGVEHE